MTQNIQKCCVPSENNLIQKNFMNYVGLADQQKPLKEMYIEQLKQQCESLVQFRVSVLERSCVISLLNLHTQTEWPAEIIWQKQDLDEQCERRLFNNKVKKATNCKSMLQHAQHSF